MSMMIFDIYNFLVYFAYTLDLENLECYIAFFLPPRGSKMSNLSEIAFIANKLLKMFH